MAPAFEFSATTSKRGASRSTRSRPAGALRSMQMLRLPRLLRRNVAPDAAPVGVGHRGLRAAAEVAARAGSRPSPRRPRGGRAAGWRRGGPASARGRGCGRRRAASRRPPRRRWRRLRGAWADGRPKCDDPSDLAVASAHDVPRHRRRGRVPAPPAARPQHHRRGGRQRGRQGHPHRRRLRRGHHHDGRGGGPGRAAPARRASPRTRSGSPPWRPPTPTRPTPPPSTPPCGSAPTSAPSTPTARCARRWARSTPR